MLFTIYVFNAEWFAFSASTPDISSTPLAIIIYAPERLLIRLKSIPERMQYEFKQNKSILRTYIESIDKLNKQYGVYAIERLVENQQNSQSQDRMIPNEKIKRTFVFKVLENVDILRLVEEYSKDPMVEYAEPDYIGQGGGTVIPNDTRFSEQWALHNTGQNNGKNGADIDATEAWLATTGNNKIIVAILDTGIDLQHPDLRSKITSGFDFVNNDDDPQDDNGHGTSIAGIVGAITNNNEGIAGICWDCTLMPVKVLDATKYGFYSWWIKGISYAVEHQASVIVMSLGGDKFSQTLKDAVDFAYNNGIVLVSITHNFGNDVVYYPAGYENVIAVGATDMNDNRWINSNYGKHIDVVAPGVSILTTTKGGNYSRWTGTSQAAAHIAGLSALLLSLNPELSPSQIREIIEKTAEDKVGFTNEDTTGWDQYYGYGRINAYQALILAKGFSPTSVKSKDSIITTWGHIKNTSKIQMK